MASHQLAIAKASFSAGLLRPDPTSLTREDIARFQTLLNSAVIQCTPRNVQKCKQWILENIAHSTARFTALGKYLTALAASFTENGPNLDPNSKREPSIKRKRLHILYLVNDLLFHTKYRINDASICGKVQPLLMNLLGSTASFTGCPKHHHKIQELLRLWEEKDYYSKDYIDKLREAVKHASEAGKYEEGNSTQAQNGDKDITVKGARSTPYVMPAVHGDSSTPWFDLPAGNLMPHIVPNSTRPINPDLIKPLQFIAGPADDDLVAAVKGLLGDAQVIYGETAQDDRVAWDMDELGQPIVLDEITGDVLEGEGYYGWSRAFCDKMKRRRNGLDKPVADGGRARTGRSESRSSSRSRKRRRFSRSDDDRSSPDDHRRSRARREYSSSRSRSPDIKHHQSIGHSHSRSGNRSYSESPPRSSSPSKVQSYPRDVRPAAVSRPAEGLLQKQPMPPPIPFQGYNAQFPPPPPAFPLPPPNMNFNNNWPPPPHLHHLPNNFNPSNPSQNWPPPPPPPQYQQQQQQQQPGAYPPAGAGGWQPPMQYGNGRGYNNNAWNTPTGPRGRGDRGNYRGRGDGQAHGQQSDLYKVDQTSHPHARHLQGSGECLWDTLIDALRSWKQRD
ncbi:hypothetical protein D0Z07_7354 [Hyphodiscus hymeniophilus]|uniref:CID domain-containing protein n=1 Tax=Hyphodiscus hymeniophilus TaxID=353542 RepID=A0A9P6VEZ3_9HELO|nr:hypothetical protein D0Z07_7354 [Hyphodiscus hymeniophilus]